ncbi:hypothetical protein F4774DRAFT_378874 [Daldinia eschscholtzii]|nr:hypothetical protein F4774DRAFT_378874 [Daldinia eschscholtzii]
MNPSLTIRCTGRLPPRLLPGSQATRLLRPRQLVSPRTLQLPKRTPYFSQGLRYYSGPPPGATQGVPPPNAGPQQQQQQQQQQGANWRAWALFNLAGLAAAFLVAVVLKTKNAQDSAKNAPMNMTSFSPFTITSKEQVSPTAFVLSVRAEQGGGGKDPSLLLQRAWDHGLWSVEVKQPQLQIARHYTPLPPLTEEEEKRKREVVGGSGGGGDSSNGEGEELRFLIRKVDGGEMSTYLSKLQVGEKVWLRGPHLGFDIARRLGDTGKHVVFLAGGTGIAPALQVARRVLDDHSPATETTGERKEEKPTVSILWANRYTADALGRQQQTSRGSSDTKGRSISSLFGGSASQTPSNTNNEQQSQTPEDSTLALQIRELQAKHPDHFRISYFVDEERHFISEHNLRLALKDSSSSPTASTMCTWHSPSQLVILPDDNDLGRRASPCTCLQDSNNNKSSPPPPPPTTTTAAAATHTGAGADLICVSGPDGFVAAYAGPKRWFGGTERQGPVRGILGEMMEDGKFKIGGIERNWLVLKL